MRDILRKETAVIHQKIEELPVNRYLLAGPEPDHYRNILIAWQSAHRQLEPALLSKHRRQISEISQKLEVDLKNLGSHTNAEQYAFTPKAETMTSWGIQYVLLGATLGRAMIAKKLRKSPFKSIQSNHRFFDGFGKQTWRYWQTFCTELDHLTVGDSDMNTAVEAAKRAFQTIGETLSAALSKNRAAGEIATYL